MILGCVKLTVNPKQLSILDMGMCWEHHLVHKVVALMHMSPHLQLIVCLFLA